MAEDNDNGEEEEPAAMPMYPDRGPNREQMASGYLPDGDNWTAKTFLDTRDPAAVAALSQLGEMYPEVEELQEFVDEVVDQFMQAQTSVAGQSRQEYKSILQSMYGGNPDSDNNIGVALKALGADEDD